MSDRKYISYKFLYDDDLGRQIIKRHRSYLNADGVTGTATSISFDDEKVTGTSQGLRNVLSYVDTDSGKRQLIAKIPYAPDDPLLVEHIEEILAQPSVECGDYRGETLLTGGSTNSIQ